MQFGPKARKRVYANLQGYFLDGDQDFFFHDDVDVSDSDDGGGHGGNGANGGNGGAGENVYGGGAGYGNGGGNDDHNNDDDEDGEYGDEDEDLPDSNTAEDAAPHVSDAEALESAFASLNGGPLNSTVEAETALNPPAQPSTPSAQQTPPTIPRVARARINLTALSQRYNVS